MEVLGLDIGGTGIKGAVVDTDTGEMLTERYRLLTPKPATPKAMIATMCEIINHFDWHGPVGCGFPSAVKSGVVLTASNVSKQWIGFNLKEALQELTGCEVTVLNDADAAGLAEMRFGAGRDQDGVVLIVTLGTGIGVALFVEGRLVPNLELGHIEIGGKEAEKLAAAIVRKQAKLSWKKWGKRVNRYLTTMEQLLWPDLIIVGGGVSKNHDKFFPYLTTQTPVVAAQMLNQAGIIGAGLAAVT
ncbi:MAG: ROK family protein [Anaerolineae bacterium]